MILEPMRDHIIHHVSPFQDHMPISQDHVGESSSLQFGYNLALGLGQVDLGFLRVILS